MGGRYTGSPMVVVAGACEIDIPKVALRSCTNDMDNQQELQPQLRGALFQASPQRPNMYNRHKSYKISQTESNSVTQRSH